MEQQNRTAAEAQGPGSRPLPLAGLRVLTVEQYGAGPFGSMLLADLGADVIKIENPSQGDVSRTVGPYGLEAGDSLFYQSFNRNKRAITLDLKHPEEKRVLHALAARTDALMDNLRGDLPDKLGLTYAALSEANPTIVCAHLTGYGREGSRRSWPGYDFPMQAETGYFSLTGEPDGPPARVGLSLVDYMSGTLTAFGLLAAVIGARASGRGTDVDVSLFDTALHNLSYVATWYLNAGHVQRREPRSAHPSLVPSQLFRTRDHWLFIMCNKEKFWPLLAARIGRPAWATDPRFATFAVRFENRAVLTRELEAVLRERTTSEWLAILSGVVPIAPVHDVAGALDNPFVTERNDIREFSAPGAHRPTRMVASPVRIGGQNLPTRRGPALGADTEEVLRAAGFDAAAIQGLRDRKAI